MKMNVGIGPMVAQFIIPQVPSRLAHSPPTSWHIWHWHIWH